MTTLFTTNSQVIAQRLAAYCTFSSFASIVPEPSVSNKSNASLISCFCSSVNSGFGPRLRGNKSIIIHFLSTGCIQSFLYNFEVLDKITELGNLCWKSYIFGGF